VSNDEEGGRPAWDNQVQFLLACIAYAVGLGNIWRFPYLAQTYGGGAFLIPYILMLVFEGVPLFLLELAVGQRLRQGSIGAWTKFHPYLGGIGIGSMVVSFMVGLYYNTIIAWCFWYICNSFTDPLPYAKCPLTDNNTAYVEECQNSGVTDYFWYRDTLNISPSIDDTGGIVWWVLICLILAWTLIWVTMIKGIESSGKAMYVTATFPYLVLFIFLVRGLTLRARRCDVQTYLAEASQGTGLAFIVFTEAIINMPGSPVWSVLFFMMLLSLGLGSMFGTVEGVVTPLFDLGLKVPKPILTGIICLISCAIGLIFCTRAGNYWVDIFNNYAGSIPLLVIAFFEITVISWAYGLKKFDEDLEWMFGKPDSIATWILYYYFRSCWFIISPVILLVVFGAYLYTTATGQLSYSAW
uniref:Transporter n=1 Tax=Ciona savignyi TaxID=51511 RepID=H2YE67_CIOSA